MPSTIDTVLASSDGVDTGVAITYEANEGHLKLLLISANDTLPALRHVSAELRSYSLS